MQRQRELRLVSQNSSLDGEYGNTKSDVNLCQRRAADNELRKRLLPTADIFIHQGRLNKPRRQGQFQYRFGRKVQPKDKLLWANKQQ